MTVRDLRKVCEVDIAIFNYKEEPIYNQYNQRYSIEYLDEKEVISIIPYDNLLQVKVLV